MPDSCVENVNRWMTSSVAIHQDMVLFQMLLLVSLVNLLANVWQHILRILTLTYYQKVATDVVTSDLETVRYQDLVQCMAKNACTAL